jgi:hypothetical protein
MISKELRPPLSKPSAKPHARTIRGSVPKRVERETAAKEEREAHRCLKESEKMLGDAVARLGGKRTRSKTSSLACGSAGQFVRWWREKKEGMPTT